MNDQFEQLGGCIAEASLTPPAKIIDDGAITHLGTNRTLYLTGRLGFA